MVIPGAEHFFVKRGKTGCVLVHGLSSSPSEMRPLGDYLAEAGYTVYAPLLPGHGTTPRDLARTTWNRWYEEMEDAVKRLTRECNEVFLMGLSMGGALSLLGAANGLPVKGVVSLAAPIYIKEKKAYLAPYLRFIMPYKKKEGLFKKKGTGQDKSRSLKGGYRRVAYDCQPLNGVYNLLKLIKELKRKIHRIRIPALIVHSIDDSIVDFKSARYIYDRIASDKKQLCILEHSGHIVTMGNENEKIFNQIKVFIEEV